MTVAHARGAPLSLDRLSREIDIELRRFLAEQQLKIGGEPAFGELLWEYVSRGGKRLRPLLCFCGWRAAGGSGDPSSVVRLAAAIELFHTFTLIHDDIIDQSATRRGKPSLHCTLASTQRAKRSHAQAERYGLNIAMLLGDLALAWSDELLHTSGLAERRLQAVLPLLDAMRTEVMYGEYLDVDMSGTLQFDTQAAIRIALYKTAKYTVERPLHLGAATAGAESGFLAALSAFALPLGVAFQLRDDVLGVFGDPEATGKSTLDDLRDGKATALLALALELADHHQRDTLRGLVGNPSLTEKEADDVRAVFLATGALTRVEEMIDERLRNAGAAMDLLPLPDDVAATLREMTAAMGARQ